MTFHHLLITGIPGIGKTTIVKKLVNNCKSQFKIIGFYTEEVKQYGRRIGFDIVDVTGDNRRVSLARVDSGEGPREGARVGQCEVPRVGKYLVNVKQFEDFIAPIFGSILSCVSSSSSSSSERVLVIIDEIGKMEMFSELFRRTIKQLFDTFAKNNSVKILASIPINSQLPEITQLKQRQDTHVITVTHANRNEMVDEIVQMLISNSLR